ncbi:apolipoprotein N-acyltransferase [Bowdeniella nasicola]|uniref:Apolipoprotein N-acyltransferase n=2 Tax=Bowdeniella nasicola TaxID=208480 RepID=A0A1Q5Q440_9ACTO|nr:apolipoprotein N-acyltransferase [Bowdeniella nasicola]
MSFVPRFLLAALAGGALNLAFPHLRWWWMAIVALALLHVALGRSRPGRAFAYGTAFGLAFFLPHLSWAITSVGTYIPWAALATLQACIIGLYACLRAVALKSAWYTRSASVWIDAVGSGLLFVAIEGMRSRFPFGGFAWGLVGYSQVEGPIVRLAAYGGTTLVGFTVVVAAVLLARVINPAGERSGRFLSRAAQVAVAGALPLVAALAPLAGNAETGSLSVGVVQGNVPRPPLADGYEQARRVTANHRDETVRLVKSDPQLDLIVWPESASDLDPRTNDDVLAMIHESVLAAKVPILVGTQEYFENGRYNQHLLFVPDGNDVRIVDSYTKQHPVPFGEYIPYRDFFAKISSDVGKVRTDMLPGQKPGIMDLALADRNVRVGDAICFEISVEDLVRDSVNRGAQVLIVPTNNASFGDSAEAAQQTDISRFRAIEFSRATVQASTVGTSAIIDPRGRIVGATELWTSDHLVAKVALRTSETFAAKAGIIPVLGSAILALGWVVVGPFTGEKRASRRHYSDLQRKR